MSLPCAWNDDRPSRILNGPPRCNERGARPSTAKGAAPTHRRTCGRAMRPQERGRNEDCPWTSVRESSGRRKPFKANTCIPSCGFVALRRLLHPALMPFSRAKSMYLAGYLDGSPMKRAAKTVRVVSFAATPRPRDRCLSRDENRCTAQVHQIRRLEEAHRGRSRRSPAPALLRLCSRATRGIRAQGAPDARARYIRLLRAKAIDLGV